VIAWWISLWDRREDPTVLAMIRIGISLVVLADYAEMARLGLVELMFAPHDAGGLVNVTTRTPLPELYRWFPATADTAWGAWALVVASMALFGLGVVPWLTGAIFVLVSAQHALLVPLADRGIDTLIRNAVLILVFSKCDGRWSPTGRRRTEVPAWPRHLLIVQLAVMYFAAGIQKTALTWGPLGDFGALYLILQDPSIARFRFGWLASVYPLTQIATATTLAFEWGAVLLPLAYWFRDTRERPGRWRALLNRVDFRATWATVGVFLHIGIAVTMQLGIFPWAMLALYPALFHPEELSSRMRLVPRMIGR